MFESKLSYVSSKVCFLKKLFFSLFAAAFLSTGANAALSCDVIYVNIDSGSGIATYNPTTNTYTVTTATSRGDPTLALGYIPGTTNLRMYAWYFGQNNFGDGSSAAERGNVRYIDSAEFPATAGNWHDFGSMNDFSLGVGASGGEVNQMTGEIYMTGPYTGTANTGTSDNNFRLGIFNPTTKSYYVGRVRSIARAWVASDMAIDADGNAYLLVRNSSGSGSSGWFLMRVDVRNDDGTIKPPSTIGGLIGAWQGNVVGSELKNFPSGISASQIWGLAFFNGKLYFSGSSGGAGGRIYAIDPLSGQVTQAYQRSSGGDVLDMASCQVAPVIRGKIYNDEDGDGVITGSENGIDGITVQLYDSPTSTTPLSEVLTTGGGTYSFIVNSVNNVDFYVRVKQPTLEGGTNHMTQTWASGGNMYNPKNNTQYNSVYNYCTDLTNDKIESSTNKTCYGAKADGIEGSANGIANANYYSKVHVTTDLAVSRANFAFSAVSDRSDGPYSQVRHSVAVKQNGSPLIFLGANVSMDPSSISSANADADLYDDGINVKLKNGYMDIQQRGFVRGVQYDFKADINGIRKNQGELGVFIAANQPTAPWNALNSSIAAPSSGDNITFAGTIPAISTNTAIVRARYSTTRGLDATVNEGSYANAPWVVNGEVEDYLVYILSRQVVIGLKTIGTTGASGDFTFTMSNVDNSSPSSTSATFGTNAPNVMTLEPKGTVHSITNDGSAISIIINHPQTLGIVSGSTSCYDRSRSNAEVNLAFSRYQSSGKWYDNVTINAGDVRANSDIMCEFVYSAASTITVTANINERAFANDDFNLSITDIDTSSVIETNTSSGGAVLSASAILAAGHNNSISLALTPSSTGQLDRYAFTANCDGTAQNVTNGVFYISPPSGADVNCVIVVTAPNVAFPGSSEIAVIPSNNTVNGTSLVLITLKNSSGQIIPSGGDNVRIFINSDVAMQLSNGTNQISSPTTANITAIDHNNGSYTANISSIISGSAVLTFSVNGAVSPNNATATFHSDIPDLAHENTTITATPERVVNQNSQIVVTLRDRYNNPVSNENVTVEILSGNAGNNGTFFPTPPTVTEDVNGGGRYIVRFTTPIAENVTFGFKITDGTHNYSKNATTKFVPDTGCPTCNTSSIKAEPNVTEVNTTSLITVNYTDSNNNPVNGANIIIYVNSPNNASAVVTPTVNLGGGIYTANITSNVTDSYTVTFRDGGNISNKNANVEFTEGKVYFDNSFIDATNVVTINNNSTIKVYIADYFNNTVKNATVGVHVLSGNTGSFTPSGSNNGITYTADSSDPKGGYYRVFYTTSVTGNVTFGFSANGVNADASNNDTTEFTTSGGNVSGNYTTIKAEPNVTNAGNTSLITVHFADDSNNAIDGANVIIYVNSTNAASAVISHNPAINIGGGDYIANLTSNVADSYTVTFSANAAQSNKSANVLFNVNGVDQNNSYITATPTVPIGGNSTIKVYLADYLNNPIKNATVDVTLLQFIGNLFPTGVFVPAGSNINIHYTADYTDAKGGYYKVLYTTTDAGNATFGFNAAGYAVNASNNATTRFTSDNTSISNSNFTVRPHELQAGDFVNITLQLFDSHSNTQPEKNVTFKVISSTLENGTVVPGGVNVVISSITKNPDTNIAGNIISYTATATTNTSQNVTFSFDVDGVGSGETYGKTDWAKFKPKKTDPAHPNTTITATPMVTVNQNSQIVVTLVDNHNNPVNNENVTVEILSGNAGNNGTFSPAPPTVTQDGSGNGKYIVRFTTPIAENVTFGFKITDGTHNYSKNATTEFVINGIGVDNESTKFKVYPHDRLVGEQTTLDLYLTDDTGVNGVPNQNVAFFVVSRTFENGTVITNGNSVYITSPVIDHGNGTYTTTATTNTSQNVTFGFSANGQTNTSKVDWAKFNSNKTDLTNLNTNITATPMVTVNQNSQIVVTLVDNHNNPVNNENVTVEILSGNAGNNGTFSPAPPTVTQDGSGNGKYIVHFTTPVAENVTFGFRITDGTHNYSKNATTIFRSGSSSNNTSELVFNPVTPSVSVENNYTLTAIIRDDSMNPVGGETVTFNVSGGNLNATTCVTNADGRCYVLWTSTVTGSFTANARINGSHIKNSPAVKGFTAGVADENTSTFLLDSGPKVVGSIFNMNTTLRDKYYNVVPNQDVFYILTPAIEQAGFGSVGTEADNINITTGPQAISRNTLWSNLVGTYTVTVRIGSETGPEVNGSNKTAVFVHSTPTPANSYLNVTGLGPVDSNGGYYTVRTYAFDGVGPNPVPNAQINIAISNGTLSNGSMSGKNILCATNAAGYCEFQWTSPSEKGVFTINASFANGTALSSSPQQREFISGNANNTTSTLTILEAGPKTANGTDRYTAIVTLRDNNNLPAAGSVVIGVTGGLLDGSYISNSYSVDSVNGSVTVHWTSNQTGNFTITAALNTGYITNGVQQREFVSGPVSISDSEFIITPLSSVTADNSTAYNLRVIIRDGFRNLVPGEIVTFDVQEGYLNNGTVLPNTITCATLINGECYVSWVSDEVGNFSVNASVAAGMIGQTQYRDFVVGPPTNKYSNLTVLPTSSRVADNSSYFTATAYIKDDFNHPITGELVSFRVNGGWIDNTTDKGTTLTCVSIDGACSVRWRSDTPGTYRISANSSTITQIGVENRQFIATTGSASNSSLVVTPAGPVIAGIGVYTATVTARDTGGVAAPNAIIQFEVSGGVLNSDNCETNGTGSCFVTWTSNKSGNFSINATIGGTNLGGNGNAVEASPQYRVFEPDTPVTGNSLLVITPATNTIIANSGNFYTINVTARDTHNNTVPNKHINIHIEYGELDNGTGFAIGDSTCFTDTNGNCLVKWRSNKTGNYLVNATLAGISGIINSSAEDRSRMFAFDVVGSASYFTVTSYNASQPDNIPVCEESGSDIALCSISYNLNAFVQDNSGNKMEGANVTFKIFRGGEQVRDAYLNDIVTDGLHGTVQGEYSCLTNANGVCPANITLKANIAGTYEIYAIANGIDIEYDTTSNYNAFKTFVASKASNTTSRIHFNPIADKTVEADNVSSYDVTTEILDIHSNPINNALVTLNVPSGISWLDNSTAVNSSLTCTTASSGNCTVKWRSVRANDIQDITAQVEAITLSGNRTFVTGGVSSNTSNITVSTHYATTNDTVLVTVTVNDAQGNPIKDTYHNVIIYTSLANSSFAGGTSDHTGTLVNVNGTYSAILSSTKIGNTTLSFTIDGVSSSNTEWVHFNSSTICFENCEVSNATYITAQSPVKVGNDSLVTVYLGDTYGNPIDNLSVTIYAFENQTNSTVTLNGLENVTINGGIDGKYEANLTAYDKGTVMVSFILNSGYNINANDYGKNATVLFEPGNVSENESLVYVTHEIDNTTNASADGIDYYTVTVIARDAYGAILTESVTFSFEVDKGNLSSTNASSGDIQNITCATGSNGSCSVYWMSEDWGTGHINTYVNGKQVGIGFMNGVRVSTVPVEAEFRRVLFDDNLTIIDFTPSSKKAHIGDLIRYTVKLQNNIDQESVFNLNNLIPKGFSFVEGSIISSTANGTVNSTSISSSEFDAESLFIHKQGELIVVYTLRVGAGAKKGVHKSYAEAFKAGNSISNRAWVEVEITGDPMLDESLIFGTVYIDSNANGMQDKGEIGIPGVRIATAEGYVITTDQFGRYHLLNILGGEWGVGRNFIMKVDESSLPQGSTLTTANPLLRRLTPGLPVRFDFGVKLSNDIKTLETLMQGGAQ